MKKTSRMYFLMLAAMAVISAVLLSGCSDSEKPAVSESDVQRPLTCSDTDTDHQFGGWIPDEEVGEVDSICRVCSVCGKKEHESGWMPVSELPASGVTSETIDLANKMPEAKYNSLPDWDGLENNHLGDPFGDVIDGKFVRKERIEDFANYGFNYSRVPIDVRAFFKDETMQEANYMMFLNFENLLTWSIENGIHISLNYNTEFGAVDSAEPEAAYQTTLFDDPKLQDAMYRFWEFMAERYKDVPSNALDFDLLNEPWQYKSVSQYAKIITETVNRIRAIDPDRLMVVEMVNWAIDPIPELAELKVVQAFHYYVPNSLENSEKTWTKESVRKRIKRYADFSEKYDVAVILNECGAAYTSPTEYTIGWYDAMFTALDEFNIPWCLFDYCGYCGFAGFDTEYMREDTPYSMFVQRGDKYKDRLVIMYPDMLEVIQKHIKNREIKVTADSFRSNLYNSIDFIKLTSNVELTNPNGYYIPNEICDSKMVMSTKEVSLTINIPNIKSADIKDQPLTFINVNTDINCAGGRNLNGATLKLDITEAYILKPDGERIDIEGLMGNKLAPCRNDKALYSFHTKLKGFENMSDFDGCTLVVKLKTQNLGELFAKLYGDAQ